MEREFNWPKKGIKAFAPADDGAYFHLPSIRSFRGVLSQHSRAFKKSAEIVLAKCEGDGDYAGNDIFLFPVLYLYRHGVELNLKAIIRVGIELEFFEKKDVADDLKWHNLATLWNHAKKLLLHRWGSGGDNAPLYAAESVINDLHKSDPNGQVFRYDSDKDGKPHAYEKLPDHIGAANLKRTMDGLFNFLEGTWCGLEEDLRNMNDMRCDWEAEMRSQFDGSW